MIFVVEARPGAPGDPLVRVDLDPGDGSPVVSVDGALQISHIYRDAGPYTVRLRVHDSDSYVDVALQIQVAELTLLELARHLLEVIEILDIPTEILVEYLTRAIWAEHHQQRGTTLLSFIHIVDGLVSACAIDNDACDLLWPTTRALTRAIVRTYDETVDEVPDDAEMLQAAAEHVGRVTAQFFDPEFAHAVRRPETAYLANDLLAEIEAAFLFLRVARHACNRPDWRRFALPFGVNSRDPAFYAAVNRVNDQVALALATLAFKLQGYLDADLDAPGRRETIRALFAIRELQPLVEIPVGIDCGDEPCADDVQGTTVQRLAREAAHALRAAQPAGPYTDDHLVILLRVIRFRVSLSLLRLESMCPQDPTVLRARAAFEYGVGLFDHVDTIRDTIHFYLRRELDCLTVDAFHACLSHLYPVDRWPNRPAHCSPVSRQPGFR